MPFSHHFASKAPVWLTAALLAVQTAFPETCGCGRPAQDTKGHGSAISPTRCGHSGCCPSGRVSMCCAALATAQRACCGSKRAAASESACVRGPCHCVSQESPTPAPTQSASSPSAKEVLGHPNLGVVSLRIMGPQSDGALAPWDVTASPATSLERLSTLCRFLI